MNGDSFGAMQTWQKLLLAASIGVVMLLIITNILLLQIVREDDASPTSSKVAPSEQAAVPSLPAPSNAGTSRALLKELNQTKRQFRTPLEQALGQLEIMSTSTATLYELPTLLQSLLASMNEFSGAAPQLRAVSKRLKSIDKEFKSTSDLVVGFGPVLTDLEKTMQEIRADTARIRACTEKPGSCN
jgi:hypothetical protein